jgi:hypothetical protein
VGGSRTLCSCHGRESKSRQEVSAVHRRILSKALRGSNLAMTRENAMTTKQVQLSRGSHRVRRSEISRTLSGWLISGIDPRPAVYCGARHSSAGRMSALISSLRPQGADDVDVDGHSVYERSGVPSVKWISTPSFVPRCRRTKAAAISSGSKRIPRSTRPCTVTVPTRTPVPARSSANVSAHMRNVAFPAHRLDRPSYVCSAAPPPVNSS